MCIISYDDNVLISTILNIIRYKENKNISSCLIANRQSIRAVQ